MLKPDDDVMYGTQRRHVVDVDYDGNAVLRHADSSPLRRQDDEGGDLDLVAVQASAFDPIED